MFNSLQPYKLYPTRLLCPWDFPDKNTGVDCYALLQGIILIQGSNPLLLCHLQAGRFFTTSTTWEAPVVKCACMQFHLPHHFLDPQTVLHTLFYTVRLTYSHYGSQCNDLFCLLIVKIDKYFLLLWLQNYYSINTTVAWFVNRKIIELYITKTTL